MLTVSLLNPHHRKAGRPLLLALACAAAFPVAAEQVMVVTAPVSNPGHLVTSTQTPRQPVPASDGADLLKTIPGFSILRSGGSNGDPVLRGMFGSRLTILTEGATTQGGCGSRMDTPTAYITPKSYDTLTVIKGPQSVTHGPMASAGTLLFEREPELFSQPGIKGSANLLQGANGRSDQNVNTVFGNSTGYIRLDGNRSVSDDYRDGDGMGVNQLAGTVQLDGIDFDFEKVARLTPEENDNVLAVAKRVRELLKASGSKKLISLTTYHVGADPAECQSAQVTENCSFTESSRSSHHGEVLPLLTKGKDVFDFFNVMAYDAGPDFKYDVAMANYARAVGDKRKIILGQTINSQWGPAGRFVESRQNNVDRAGWQAEHGYGGFFIWTLGANNQQQPLAQQVDYFNEMKERADLMSGQSANEDVTAPTAPTGLKVMESNNAITLVWQPAADSVGVKGYSILHNGVPVGSSTDTRWTDNNIEPGGVIYRYTVKAFDAAGNLSDASNAVDVKTGPAPEAVTVAPDAPAGLSLISAGKAELSIQWRSVAGAVKYKVLRNGMQVATVAGTRFDDSGLKAATAYSYTVVAENAKGQTSLASAALKVKTQASAVKPAPAPQPSSSEAWKTGVNYKTGDIVTYKGKQYRCLQGHPSMAHWTPAETMALWQVVR